MPSILRSGVNEYSTEQDLIEYCANPPHDCILGGAPYGNKVVQISSKTVIKFGVGVTEAEAVNQSKAYELLDPKVVRIPKVHRYFSDNEDRGYIVMDLVEGEVLEPLEDPTRVRTVAGILDHLASFRQNVPGPLNHGPPCGLLFFPDEEEVPFTDVKDLEQWWNCRLLPGECAINLQGLDLVLCHLDVAPRNILWRDGEAPCLVDWASAGYYPRVFESCAQLIVEGKDGRFNRLLLDAMTKLECVESRQIALVLQAWSNMQRYQL
jgi:Phosphotransferase enzyme family